MGETERVVVIGAGISGLAATFRLKEAGKSPLVVSSGVGSSAMTSGAADLRPWTEGSRAEVSPEARAFVRTLGLFSEGGHVVSSEGFVRRADGVGARVLPLDALRGRVIGMANLPRDDFRPRDLARKLNDSPWAKRARTSFEVVETPGVVSDEELSYPLAALHPLFDEPSRQHALREAARALSAKIHGLLTGAFLGSGTEPLDVPGVLIGETLSPPEGSFGTRFEEARRKWQLRAGIEVREEFVWELAEEDRGVRLSLGLPEGASRDKDRATLWADAVVVATGGFIGHGVDVVARGLAPTAVGAVLGPESFELLGAKEGWDAAADGGQWLRPPHYRAAVRGRVGSRIVFSGDARGDVSRRAPGGTVFGAVQSGIDAAERLLRG